jgi:hypothetical protein
VDGDLRSVGSDIVVNVRLTDTAIGKQLASERRAITSDRATEDNELLVARVTAAYAQIGDMARAAAAKAQLMRRVPDFKIARLEAKTFSNHPIGIEEIRKHFISGLRKAGVPE